MKHDKSLLIGGSLKGLSIPAAPTTPVPGQLALRSGLPSIFINNAWKGLLAEKQNVYDERVMSFSPTFYARCRDNDLSNAIENLVANGPQGSLRLLGAGQPSATRDASVAAMAGMKADDKALNLAGARYITVPNGLPATLPAHPGGITILMHIEIPSVAGIAVQTLFSTGNYELRYRRNPDNTSQIQYEVRIGANVYRFAGSTYAYGTKRLSIRLDANGTRIALANGNAGETLSGSWWTGAFLPTGTIHFGASLYNSVNGAASDPLRGKISRIAIYNKVLTDAQVYAMQSL